MERKNEQRQRVEDYYDSDPLREWSRFERHPFEFPVSLHYLQKHIASESKVLDVGGGPGRYSLALAKSGCSVDLLDLSSELLELATKNAASERIQLAGTHQGTATDLGAFEDCSFDAVLCMGPVYHLPEASDRANAIAESLRVLKPGGVLAVSFISVLGRLYHVLRNHPDRIVDELQFLTEVVTANREYLLMDPDFTDAWMIQPEEVAPIMCGFRLRQLEFLGVEGPISQSETAIVAAGAEALANWIEFTISAASTPASLYGSDHLLYIGRKI